MDLRSSFTKHYKMQRLFRFFYLFLFIYLTSSYSQITSIPSSDSAANITAGTSAPPATCTPPAFYIRTSTGQTFSCTATDTFTELAAGAGTLPFSSITAATNSAALVISGSLTVTGPGTINATSLGGTAAASYATDAEVAAGYQPLAAPLTTIAGLAVTDDNMLLANGTLWQLKPIPDCTDATGNHLNYTASTNSWSCGTSTSGQPLDSDLTTIAGLAKTDDNLMLANGTTWELKSLPSCSNATTSKLLYNSSTNAFSCGTDQDTGGGGGATYLSNLNTWKVTRTSSTRLDIGTCASSNPCTAHINGVSYSFPDADIQTPVGNGTIFLYITASQVLTVGHNITSLACNNCTAVGGVSDMPADVIPIASWTVTTDAFDASGYTDWRGVLSLDLFTNGFGLTLTNRQFAVNTSVIGPFTSGTSTPPGTCTIGEKYLKTNTNQAYECTSTNTFTETSGAGSGAPTDATYITSTAHASLSAEFALGSLATGILKNITSTGIPVIAVYGDIPAGGSSTELQMNTSNFLDAAAGLTWDNTNKLLTATRSNSGATGGRIRVNNSATLAAGNAAIFEYCSSSSTCPYDVRNVYGNVDGAGATQYWALNDIANSFLPITYTAINTRLYLGRASSSGGSSITTTGANAVIARSNASVPFTFVVGAGASQSTSPLFDMVSNNGATVYNRFGPTGLVETYGSRTAAGRGLGVIMAQYKPSSLTAAVTSGNLLATAPAGTYQIATYLHTLTVPSATCTATVTLGWTYNGGAKTKTLILGHDLNTDENASDNVTVIDVDASSNITRAISNDGTCGTYSYDVTMIATNLR